MAAATITQQAIHYTFPEQKTNSIQIFGNNIPLDKSSQIEDTYFNKEIKMKNAMYYSNKNKINELNEKWKNETRFLSNETQKIHNSNFEKIVEIGYDAIPIILEEIDIEPSNLVWALNEITKVNISKIPVSINDACKMWVNWGRSQNILINA